MRIRCRRTGCRSAAASAIIAAALLGGCGSPLPSPAVSGLGASTSGSASPSAAVRSSESPPAASTPSSPSPAPGSPGSSATASADPSLLGVVKADALGLTLTFDPATTATEVGDPTLDRNVAALATGIVAAGDSANPADLVIVNVVRLRDPGVDSAWFRGWRDSYDEAACARAGGVSGHAESTIRGNDVFVGSCAGGAFTYHTRLRDGTLVVSLTSVGAGRVGERLLEHLAP